MPKTLMHPTLVLAEGNWRLRNWHTDTGRLHIMVGRRRIDGTHQFRRNNCHADFSTHQTQDHLKAMNHVVADMLNADLTAASFGSTSRPLDGHGTGIRKGLADGDCFGSWESVCLASRIFPCMQSLVPNKRFLFGVSCKSEGGSI